MIITSDVSGLPTTTLATTPQGVQCTVGPVSDVSYLAGNKATPLFSAVSHTGTGTGAVSPMGTPAGSYVVYVKITGSGATFQYSVTASGPITYNGTDIAIPGGVGVYSGVLTTDGSKAQAGFSLVFSDSFAAGDVYSFTTVGPVVGVGQVEVTDTSIIAVGVNAAGALSLAGNAWLAGIGAAILAEKQPGELITIQDFMAPQMAWNLLSNVALTRWQTAGGL